IGAWSEGFAPLAPTIKHPAFHEEREWRLISAPIPFGDDQWRVRAGRSMLIPYVPIALAPTDPYLPIRDVVVGPTPHRELAIRAADILQGSGVRGQKPLAASDPGQTPPRRVGTAPSATSTTSNSAAQTCRPACHGSARARSQGTTCAHLRLGSRSSPHLRRRVRACVRPRRCSRRTRWSLTDHRTAPRRHAPRRPTAPVFRPCSPQRTRYARAYAHTRIGHGRLGSGRYCPQTP